MDAKDWNPNLSSARGKEVVLLRLVSSRGMVTLCMGYYYPIRDAFLDLDGDEIEEKVTHWMPLPSAELPKPKFTEDTTLAELSDWQYTEHVQCIQYYAGEWHAYIYRKDYNECFSGKIMSEALNKAHEALSRK